MSYVTSPFEVLTILFVLCALASFGITILINKVHDFPFKWDMAIGAVVTVALFVTSARMMF
jgi:hypothetical protein